MTKNELLAVLSEIIANSQDSKNKQWVLNFLKEGIQDYILNFVYNSKTYQKLIFTGGTCLRKIYGLPRLSEDLDFDFVKTFDVGKFSSDLKEYFASSLQYKNIITKIANNKRTIFFKFPTVLKELNLVKGSASRQVLFVRCDFSLEKVGSYKTEVNPIFTKKLSFFVLSYDLPTLFANKILAFLQREFFKGKTQSIAFKGRDLFDLVWFFEQSGKRDFSLQPNWQRVFKELGFKNRKEVMKVLIGKAEKINKKDVFNDLAPFIEFSSMVENFSENFLEVIRNKTNKFVDIKEPEINTIS